ncbi:insertion sequence protein [Yersinia pseudotuberculosis]|nr:insertion sequence protein [Yersinia pseudotuberculosis]
MAKVDAKDPFCEQTHPVKKHGLGRTGHQRYRFADGAFNSSTRTVPAPPV